MGKFKREVSSPDLIYKTIESILIAPRTIEPQVNTLVLGAWGCGAFGGDPVQVSDLFVRALTHGNLGRLYREIHFAIPCASPRDRNYAIFLECFQKHKLQVQASCTAPICGNIARGHHNMLQGFAIHKTLVRSMRTV